jgi:probable HAF family extracellular repeat protein
VAGAACAGVLAVLSGQAFGQVNYTYTPIGHLPGASDTTAAAISADGLVVVGSSGTPLPAHAFRWTRAGGIEDLGVLPGMTESHAEGVSADGSVVVGWSQNPGQSLAFRWTAATGMVSLIDPAGCATGGSKAFAVSADGSVVVGDTDPCTAQAFRWTSAGGVELLPRLLCANDHARWVAPDGSFAVGWSSGSVAPACTGASGTQAALWPASGGVAGVGPAPGAGASAFATAASADGSVLVGAIGDPSSNTTTAARWTSASGWAPLLTGGSAPASRATSVSADGSLAVGEGPDHYCLGVGFTAGASVSFLEAFYEVIGVSADGHVLVANLLRGIGGHEAWTSSGTTATCIANCDGSTTAPYLNVADFTCFLQRYAAGDPYVKCDACAVPDFVGDFTCFLARFYAGCTAP